MLLTPQDVQLFFKLHRALMFFVNQRLKVLPDKVASPDEFSSLSPEVRLTVRDWAAQIATERSNRFLSHFCSGGAGGKCPAPLSLQ
jgi:hypothetical protein